MTADDVRAEREMREARARETAANIAPGDYYASGNTVVARPSGKQVATCETHWDACLVLMAIAPL